MPRRTLPLLPKSLLTGFELRLLRAAVAVSETSENRPGVFQILVITHDSRVKELGFWGWGFNTSQPRAGASPRAIQRMGSRAAFSLLT